MHTICIIKIIQISFIFNVQFCTYIIFYSFFTAELLSQCTQNTSCLLVVLIHV